MNNSTIDTSSTSERRSTVESNSISEKSSTVESNREHYLQQAAQISLDNVINQTGGPFGAVIVNSSDGTVVAATGNSVTTTNDPTAHAEVNAIRQACQKLNTFDLSGHTIYSSCEPCPMCFGAIYWAHLDKVYYSNTKDDAKSIGFDDSFIYEELDKPMSERTLPFQCCPNVTAKKAFDEWQKTGDKVEY